MALFVVQHQHDANTCPARDPYVAAALLNHLSRSNANMHGLDIRAEAVIPGEHRLHLIVDAQRVQQVWDFMRPFESAGTVEVLPAATCSEVAANGGCASPAPAVDSLVPSVDPAFACQTAVQAGLLLHRAHPLNCETSIPDLVGGAVMPSAHFYVRNHFQIPRIDPAGWRLAIGGHVERPRMLTLNELRSMQSVALTVTLECAGNGRSRLEPKVEGEQWELGAVSNAEWTGVPLVDVLDLAGPTATAREVLFRGADGGTVDGTSRTLQFERSLPLELATSPEPLLAYAMNGEALPLSHGFPLRLIVPGWYGVASVKWLTAIELLEQAFQGYFQTERYCYEWQRPEGVIREPVTLQRVRALITDPTEGARIPAGEYAIRGFAWSGEAPIARVEVSIDGEPWHEARLVGAQLPYSWQRWEAPARFDGPAAITIRGRATDQAGNTQPEASEWNRLGYGSNAVHSLRIQIAGEPAKGGMAGGRLPIETGDAPAVP